MAELRVGGLRSSLCPGRISPGPLTHPRAVRQLRLWVLISVLFPSLCAHARTDAGDENGLWRAFDVEGLSTTDRPTVSLPLTYAVPEDSRLLVLGTRVLTATLAVDDRGRLTLNGTPILPADPLPERVYTEEEYRRTYGQVPLVQRLVAEGRSWAEATQAFIEAFGALITRARTASREEYGISGDWEAAVTAAAAAAAEADTLALLAEPVRAGGPSTLVIRAKGRRNIRLGDARERLTPPSDSLRDSDPGTPSEQDLREAATSIYFWTSGLAGHPFLYSAAPGTAHLSGERAIPLITQVDRILAGEAIEAVAVPPLEPGEWTVRQLEGLFPFRGRR